MLSRELAIKSAARAMIRQPYSSLRCFTLDQLEAWSGIEAARREISPGCYSASYHGEHIRLEGRLSGKARQVVERYRRFCLWMKEGRHGWEPTGRVIHYMDNSEEVEERSKLTGELRQRMTVPPHGDACF